ncbi:MAG: kdtA, partial [Fibrobacteres bacterium]|nr:kdtA [Fibrobacterota bacterium]
GAAYLEDRCAGLRRSERGSRIHASIAPFDHPRIVGRFLDYHRAVGLCLYEVELWPHYLSACRDRRLPATLVSGRLTGKAARAYIRFGGAGARLLDGLSWIQAQSEGDAKRFRSLTGTEVLAGADFKAAHFLADPSNLFRPSPPSDTGEAPGSLESSRPRSRFAFLSLHYRELLLLEPTLPDLMAHSDLICFPRKLDELPRFRARLEPLGFAVHSLDPGARHLLVDAMGLIGSLLPGCHSAFVGGSLVPLGCHNLWEPLLSGARILFGPFYGNQEALAGLVIRSGIGEVVRDPTGLGAFKAPGPEIAEASGKLARDLRQGLDSALSEGRRRIFATFYPDAIAGKNGDDPILASGKNKGQ